MLTYIKIDGFKSFRNFEMYFTPFTVIAGTNASGKSNLFDALKLLSTLVESNSIESAFHSQRGELSELFTLYKDGSRATEMSFVVEMLVDPKLADEWGSTAQLSYTRLRYELNLRLDKSLGLDKILVTKEKLTSMQKQSDTWAALIPNTVKSHWIPAVKTARQLPFFDMALGQDTNGRVMFGGIIYPVEVGGKRIIHKSENFNRIFLSRFNTVENTYMYAAKKEIASWRFLELQPDELRVPSDKKDGFILGSNGRNLAAALYKLKQSDAYNMVVVSRIITKFIPNYVKVDVVDDEANQQYIMQLTDRYGQVYTSRLLSEGTLRLLALCVYMLDASYTGTACFEEPENGIHPYRINQVIKLLSALSTDFVDTSFPLRQVIVNTHSPILVNYANQIVSNVVSIHFSRMVTSIVNIDGGRTIVSKTSMLPVKPELLKSFDNCTEADRNISTREIQEYLSNQDGEV